MWDRAASGEGAGGLFCFTLCSGCSIKHISRAARGRSRLPQQPCKHAGQPAASQLVLEISLGKCSQLRGFYSSEWYFCRASYGAGESTAHEHLDTLGQQRGRPGRSCNASGFAYHSLKSKQIHSWLWFRQCWGPRWCPWEQLQPVPPSLCSPAPALPVPAHLGWLGHAGPRVCISYVVPRS